MRLIDGDALVETIDRHIQVLRMFSHCGSPEWATAIGAYLGLIEDIKNEPTIEPGPPKGQWVKDEVRSKNHIEPIFICSACNHGEAWGVCECTKYCPDCGAKMVRRIGLEGKTHD